MCKINGDSPNLRSSNNMMGGHNSLYDFLHSVELLRDIIWQLNNQLISILYITIAIYYLLSH